MTDFCRLCASLKTLDHLTPMNEPGLWLTEKLLRCCQLLLPVDGDLLPQNVCGNCVQRLDDAWSFAECVADAQRTLMKAFSTTAFARASGTENETARQISQTDREEVDASIKLQSAITSLHIQHYSIEEIASSLNVDIDSVQSWINAYESLRKKPSGRAVELRESAIVPDLCAHTTADKSFSISNEPLQEHYADWYHHAEASEALEQHSPSSQDIEYDQLDDEQSSNSFQMADELQDSPRQLVDGEESTSVEVQLGRETFESVAEETWKDVPWKCGECAKQFTSTLDIQAHFNEHHGNGNAGLRITCVDCRRAFTRLNVFVNHVRYVHRSALKYCCDVCCDFMVDQKALTDHMFKIHSRTDILHLCPMCGRGFQNSSHYDVHVKRHAPAAERVQYSCDLCQKNCSTKANLISHMRIHSGIREFTCDQCGRSFVQKGHLQSHIMTHGQTRPFVCSVCDKSFKTPARLATHHKVHTNHRPHKCLVCNRAFRERTTLNEHMRIHTGAMPFECEFCGKRFRFTGVLVTHRRLHTGERPYSCIDCNHHFTNWPNYNKHMIRRHGKRPHYLH